MGKYQESGVDIEAGNQFVKDIKNIVKQTRRTEVLADVGGFAALFELKKYKNPVLVSSTDGVGTKLLLAHKYGQWKNIGIDCVAMCVNDIGCYGAEPLFFLDYLAVGKLDSKIMKEILLGMALACKEVGCSLLGGETAEMPGIYPPEKFDCAGFSVGVVEKEEIIDGRNIEADDVVIGVASSGFHSNGFSLIRKIIETNKLNLEMHCAETDRTLAETLLLPTKLYTPLILKLKKKVRVKGIAHITGGGLIENPPRVLPPGLKIELKEKSWPIPPIMQTFADKAGLDREEFLRVFNCGIGLVFVIAAKESEATLKAIHDCGEKGWTIGKII